MNQKTILATAILATLISLSLATFVIPIATAQEYENELVIISPHRKEILDNFKLAFEAYATDVLGVEVTIMSSYYSSGDCYTLAKEWAGAPEADIWWGGGVDLFMEATEEGLLLAHKCEDWDRIPADWFGIPAKDPDGYWIGYALSGFGFVYNTEYLAAYGLPEPNSWEDMLNPVYRDHVAMCTPARSGSTHMLIEIVLQGMGLDEGWAYLRKMAVNVGLFTARSYDVEVEVDRGEFGVGLVVDYYGFSSTLAGNPVKFSYPEDYIVVNPDSIAILDGCAHPEIAKAFVDYVLSEEGQKLSMGIEQRGVSCPSPRLSVWSDITLPDYLPDVSELDTITYDSELGSDRWGDVNTIFEDTIENKHSELKESWESIEAVEAELSDLEADGYDVTAGRTKIEEAKTAFGAGDYALATTTAEAATDTVLVARIASLEEQVAALESERWLYAGVAGIAGLIIGALLVPYMRRK